MSETGASSSQDVIHIEDLTRRFGPALALDRVSLRVPRGSVFGLVGANGAGKTTLIKHVLGLLRAQAGTVRVFGRDPTADPAGVLGRLGGSRRPAGMAGDHDAGDDGGPEGGDHTQAQPAGVVGEHHLLGRQPVHEVVDGRHGLRARRGGEQQESEQGQQRRQTGAAHASSVPSRPREHP